MCCTFFGLVETFSFIFTKSYIHGLYVDHVRGILLQRIIYTKLEEKRSKEFEISIATFFGVCHTLFEYLRERKLGPCLLYLLHVQFEFSSTIVFAV